MTTLSTALVSAALRETSGQRTMARYAYQVHFAILAMLDKHETGDDYRIVFDYVDDVVLLDSSDNPKKMRLYQVKTKAKGQWTIAQIASRAGKAPNPRSIIGKMYFNIRSFELETEGIVFVSNAPFDVLMTPNKKSSDTDTLILGSQLESSELDRLNAAVAADYPSEAIHPFAARLTLMQSSLGLADQDHAVVGRIVAFVEKEMGVTEVPARALYDTLVARAIAATGTNQTFADESSFLAKKSLCRAQIQDLVADAAIKRGFFSHWSLIESECLSAGLTTRDILRLKSSAARYIAYRASGEKTAVHFVRQVKSLATTSASLLSCTMILDCQSLIEKDIILPPSWTSIDMKGACLVEGFEILNEV